MAHPDLGDRRRDPGYAPPMSPPLSRASRASAALVAMVLLLLVAVIYTSNPAPPGHPWSGITLSLLAFSLLGRAAVPPQHGRSVMISLLLSALALASALSWFLSARGVS